MVIRNASTLGIFALMIPIFCVNTSDLNYIIIIDAGSSGSRLHVYSYPEEDAPNLTEILSTKVKPGLSSYTYKPDEAGKTISSLLKKAQGEIPEEKWGTTSIYLYGTGGLRLISTDDAEKILDICRAAISTFPFHFEDDWAKIITGTQEGLYGWIAANYLQGNFKDSSTSTIGIVEMGGASSQVTFAPSDVTNIPKDLLHEINVNQHSYQVYTHSYLEYGLDKVQKLYQQTVIDDIEKYGNACYQVDTPEFLHSATGSFSKCYVQMEKIFNKKAPCAFPPCSFDGIFQPKVTDENFLAIENYHWITNFFEISGDSWSSDLIARGTQWCKKSYSKALLSHPDEPADFIPRYCFASAYLLQLLDFGFDWTPEFVRSNVKIAKSIHDVDIDWAIGCAFSKIEHAPLATIAKPGLTSTHFWMIVALFLGFVGCCIAPFFRTSKNSYRKVNNNPVPPV